MSYHRVSPDDYKGNPWFQDHRTGMFFQFMPSTFHVRPDNRTEQQKTIDTLRYIRKTYGSPVNAWRKWKMENTDPTDIIEEALREYVGDGDGADEAVLAAHNAKIWQEGWEFATVNGGPSESNPYAQ